MGRIHEQEHTRRIIHHSMKLNFKCTAYATMDITGVSQRLVNTSYRFATGENK